MSDKATSGDSWRDDRRDEAAAMVGAVRGRAQRFERRQPDVDVGVLQQAREERRDHLLALLALIAWARQGATPIARRSQRAQRMLPAVGDALEALGDRALLEQRERHHRMQVPHLAAQEGDIVPPPAEGQVAEAETEEEHRRERQEAAEDVRP